MVNKALNGNKEVDVQKWNMWNVAIWKEKRKTNLGEREEKKKEFIIESEKYVKSLFFFSLNGDVMNA